MAKASKILAKVLAGSKNIRFGDLQILLEGLGFRLRRISGSHHIYRHPDLTQSVSVQPDNNRQAKPYQLQQLVKLIEQNDLTLNNEGEDET
jgi:predicted RNA binding protein YcfA (HicA-like mRNA interferase family)